MIEKFTEQQWQEVAVLREKYRAIGICTQPSDRQSTEIVLGQFYDLIGKKRPIFVWLGGPLSCCIAGVLLGQLRGQLGNQLWDQLRGQLRDQLRDQLGNQLWDQLGDQLGDQLWGQLRGQLGDQLGDQLWGQLRGQLGNQLGGALWGQEESYWIAFYKAIRDIGKIYPSPEINRKLELWDRLAQSTGWWLPYENICLCAERPKIASFDNEHRLHAARGPAIECRDGYKVYTWHGTRVPGEWIEQAETFDPAKILSHPNIEQRRAGAEIVGWKNILAKLQPRVIDRDYDPQIGTLLEVDLPDAPGERFLQVRCGTGREFVLPVPREYNTALEANAATYNVPPQLLRQIEVRT